MATGILYTQAQVTNAQLRAQVAMYLISQSIENGFYYFGNPVYKTYKALQYDIYTLFNVIGNEGGFISYSSAPTAYEMNFYNLVGAMINKIKQFDVYGAFGGAVNPNAQIPNQTTVTISVLVGYNKNTIPFTTDSGSPAFVLSSYNTTYKFLYGNNPDPLSIYLTPGGNEFLDETTAPTIVRVNPSDINSDILSITWPFSTAQTGYVLIGGIAPAGIGSPSGGGGGGSSIPFTYSENDLLQDSNGAWYLPLSLPDGYFVVYASSNGTSIGNALDENFTPSRLYNFTDNSPQVIKVNIMK